MEQEQASVRLTVTDVRVPPRAVLSTSEDPGAARGMETGRSAGAAGSLKGSKDRPIQTVDRTG